MALTFNDLVSMLLGGCLGTTFLALAVALFALWKVYQGQQQRETARRPQPTEVHWNIGDVITIPRIQAGDVGAYTAKWQRGGWKFIRQHPVEGTGLFDLDFVYLGYHGQ